MDKSQAGREARQNGQDFEDLVKVSFSKYREAGIAYLDNMPVPTKPIYVGGKCWRVTNGKAPFDVYGYKPTRLPKTEARFPIFVGLELKSSSDVKTSLPIIAPDKDGTGLQYHQLAALGQLAMQGGIARILWSNAGQYGLLREAEVLHAYQTYTMALEGKSEARKSIPWEAFKVIDFTQSGPDFWLNWLEVDHV